MKFLTMEEQLKYYRNKRIKKQTLESYFLSAGFQYIEPSVFSPYTRQLIQDNGRELSLVKVIDGRGEIFTMRGDMTAGIIEQIGQQAIESKEVKLYYDGKVFMTSKTGQVTTRDQMGVEWIGGDVSLSTQALIRLSAQAMLHQQEKVVVEISHIAYFLGLVKTFDVKKACVPRLQQLLNSKNEDDLETYLLINNYSEECVSAFKEILTLQGSWLELESRLSGKEDFISQRVLRDLRGVEEGLQTMEANGEVHFDLSIIPSYDYYTGVVFKGFSTKNYDELISGGQYLIETGKGRKIKAVGFSLYEGALQ